MLHITDKCLSKFPFQVTNWSMFTSKTFKGLFEIL